MRRAKVNQPVPIVCLISRAVVNHPANNTSGHAPTTTAEKLQHASLRAPKLGSRFMKTALFAWASKTQTSGGQASVFTRWFNYSCIQGVEMSIWCQGMKTRSKRQNSGEAYLCRMISFDCFSQITSEYMTKCGPRLPIRCLGETGTQRHSGTASRVHRGSTYVPRERRLALATDANSNTVDVCR